MNYKGAQEMLGKRDRKKLANNTYLERRDESTIAVKLHNTDVVTFTSKGHTTYNTGGWRTVTTKERMNSFGLNGWHLWSGKGIWYIGNGPSWFDIKHDHIFADGITIGPRGGVHKAGTKSSVKKVDKLKKQIREYSKQFVSELFAGNVPKPSGGDCWYCFLHGKDGQTWGEKSDNNHLQNHLKEKYYVPSLLVRAIDVIPVFDAAKWCLGDLWWESDGKATACYGRIAQDQLTKALRRYLYRQFGIGS